MIENHFTDLKPEELATIPKNLITKNGKPRCRFEMIVRWPENAGRKVNPFTYRGDKYDITEHSRMLCSLLKLFIKDYHGWLHAELYDNVYAFNDCNRLVLALNKNQILTNRLNDYEEFLKDFPLPQWLRIAANKQ